jgi:hypothetical protein
MSLVLVVIGIIVLVVGLPWLIAAVGFVCWAAARCCNALLPSRALKPPLP